MLVNASPTELDGLEKVVGTREPNNRRPRTKEKLHMLKMIAKVALVAVLVSTTVALAQRATSKPASAPATASAPVVK